MAYAQSAEGYDVVTPVLSKVILSSDDSHIDFADVENPKSKDSGNDAGENFNRTGEAAASEAKPVKVIEINGTQYIEASGKFDQWRATTVNGIVYVPGDPPSSYKTAYNILHTQANANGQEFSRGEINNTSHSQFRGKPIIVHVGTSQEYAVHPSILSKSRILGSLKLDEAEDGSLSVNLPEDPIQFERLLTYLYRGTWTPDCAADCVHGSGFHGHGQVCSCWDNKQYMELYAMACKYEVCGIKAIITPRLDLCDDVVMFCEAFRSAYEQCQGDPSIRELFRRNLVTVFENNLPKAGSSPWYERWAHADNDDGNAAVRLAELASCGGEFAVDLLRAFAMAKETAIRETVNDAQLCGGDGCFKNDEEADSGWGGDNLFDNIRQASQGETNQLPEDNITTINPEEIRKINTRLFELEEVVFVDHNSSTLLIQEDVKIMQGKLRGLEDMMSTLQVSKEGAAINQQVQAGFEKAIQGYSPQGWISPATLKSSHFQPGCGGCGVNETLAFRHPTLQEEQDGRDRRNFEHGCQPAYYTYANKSGGGGQEG